MIDCTTLDRLITPYVDGGISPDERDAIVAHLRDCGRCRGLVEAEAAARQVLRSHAGAARALGEAPAWTPRVSRLGKPGLVVAYRGSIAAAAVVAAVTVGVVVLRPQTIEAVGIIGDSRCGPQHRLSEPFSHDERTCTLNCVKRGAKFVLLADGVVYALRNQDFPGLADFAGARVVVSGRPDGKHDITLSRISIAGNAAAPFSRDPDLARND